MSRELRLRLVAGLGGAAAHLLLSTARFEPRGAEVYLECRRRGQPVIFVLWHGRLLPLCYWHRGQGIATLISRSADGEAIARLVARWGYRPVRGSSTRGAVPGLRELVLEARAGRSLAITPDGPRGPRQRMKLGPLAAARLTGLPLLPVAAGADRAWWFGSWDRFLVPKPFARIVLLYGTLRTVPPDAGAEELAQGAAALEEELNRLTREADDAAARR